jgi:fructose-1,6-bisphosphatase/inositol monophosphatase family enzyme
MIPDAGRVCDLIRDTALAEVLPRFRRLADHHVREKKPGDLVTVADIEAERRLTDGLRAMMPGSVTVGEEAAAADPRVLDALTGDDPVWIIDPVDGTQNFARGRERFAIIVALCRHGRTLAGWIHDPLGDRMAFAEAGEGAWLDGERLHLRTPPELAEMAGSLAAAPARRLRNTVSAPPRLVRYGCVGQEYIDLSRGILHFALYRKLKPWDHAAGVLLHAESGGHARLVDGTRLYRPFMLPGDSLLLAPDAATWSTLNSLLKSF